MFIEPNKPKNFYHNILTRVWELHARFRGVTFLDMQGEMW